MTIDEAEHIVLCCEEYRQAAGQTVALDGFYTADQLEAMAILLRAGLLAALED